MSQERRTVSISILDNQYQVACPVGEQVALVASARHLDQKMREIRENSKLVGLERVAVMAALNVTNDLINKNAEKDAAERYNNDSLSRMHTKLDKALAKFSSN